MSSLRRQHFSEISKTYSLELQLLRDVDTRWSSTLYMIERALILDKVRDLVIIKSQCNLFFCQPLDAISYSQEFGDLHSYQLSDLQWEALAIVREILLVSYYFSSRL